MNGSHLLGLIIGFFAGVLFDLWQHGALARTDTARRLTKNLLAVYWRWSKKSSILGALRGQKVIVALTYEEGQALQEAAVFCSRFGSQESDE